jgi:hypothetical protein
MKNRLTALDMRLKQRNNFPGGLDPREYFLHERYFILRQSKDSSVQNVYQILFQYIPKYYFLLLTRDVFFLHFKM